MKKAFMPFIIGSLLIFNTSIFRELQNGNKNVYQSEYNLIQSKKVLVIKDTTDCKTYLIFKNSTKIPLNVSVYDEQFDPQDFFGPKPKHEFRLEVGKSKKIKVTPETTYYFLAGGATRGIKPELDRYIKGEIEVEECKTETEVFE